MAQRVEAGIRQHKANNTLVTLVHEQGPEILFGGGPGQRPHPEGGSIYSGRGVTPGKPTTEMGAPYVYRYTVPAKDGGAVVAFQRSDSKLIVPTAISKLTVS